MNIQAFKMALVLLAVGAIMPAWAEPIQVQTLDDHLNDAGCAYTFRKAPYNALPVLIEGPEGAFMKLGGKKAQLNRVETPSDANPEDYMDRYEYRTGDYHVTVDRGKGRTQEGGMDFPKGRLIIRHKDQTLTVPIKGGCGC